MAIDVKLEDFLKEQIVQFEIEESEKEKITNSIKRKLLNEYKKIDENIFEQISEKSKKIKLKNNLENKKDKIWWNNSYTLFYKWKKVWIFKYFKFEIENIVHINFYKFLTINWIKYLLNSQKKYFFEYKDLEGIKKEDLKYLWKASFVRIIDFFKKKYNNKKIILKLLTTEIAYEKKFYNDILKSLKEKWYIEKINISWNAIIIVF